MYSLVDGCSNARAAPNVRFKFILYQFLRSVASQNSLVKMVKTNKKDGTIEDNFHRMLLVVKLINLYYYAS